MKKTLLLFSLLISTFCFSQTVFHAQYFQLGMWDSEIDDYEIIAEESADIYIKAFENYAIFTNPDNEKSKIYWELDEESSSSDVTFFYVEDFEGEPASIAFAEEQEEIYIFFVPEDGQWQTVMILSDIIVEE